MIDHFVEKIGDEVSIGALAKDFCILQLLLCGESFTEVNRAQVIHLLKCPLDCGSTLRLELELAVVAVDCGKSRAFFRNSSH